MNCAYHVSVDQAAVLFRPAGRFTEVEFIQLLRVALADPRRSRQFAHIWDTREIDELVMDSDVISMYRTLLNENVDRLAQEKVAIIAKRPLTRTFSSMLARVSPRHPAVFQLFETMESAADWVGVSASALTNIPAQDWTEI